LGVSQEYPPAFPSRLPMSLSASLSTQGAAFTACRAWRPFLFPTKKGMAADGRNLCIGTYKGTAGVWGRPAACSWSCASVGAGCAGRPSLRLNPRGAAARLGRGTEHSSVVPRKTEGFRRREGGRPPQKNHRHSSGVQRNGGMPPVGSRASLAGGRSRPGSRAPSGTGGKSTYSQWPWPARGPRAPLDRAREVPSKNATNPLGRFWAGRGGGRARGGGRGERVGGRTKRCTRRPGMRRPSARRRQAAVNQRRARLPPTRAQARRAHPAAVENCSSRRGSIAKVPCGVESRAHSGNLAGFPRLAPSLVYLP
jgi:hypothetical protein